MSCTGMHFTLSELLAGVLSQERLGCSVVCWQDPKVGYTGAAEGDVSCGEVKHRLVTLFPQYRWSCLVEGPKQ